MGQLQEEKKPSRLKRLAGWLKRKSVETGKSLGKGLTRAVIEGNIPRFTETVLFSGDEKSTRKLRSLFVELPKFYESTPEFIRRKMKTVAYKRLLNNGYKNLGLIMSTPGIGVKLIDVMVNVLSPYEERVFLPNPYLLQNQPQQQLGTQFGVGAGQQQPLAQQQLMIRSVDDLLKRDKRLSHEKLMEALWGIFLYILERQKQLVIKALRDKYRITKYDKKTLDFAGGKVTVEYVETPDKVFIISYKYLPLKEGGVDREIIYVAPPDSPPSYEKGYGDINSVLTEALLQGELMI